MWQRPFCSIKHSSFSFFLSTQHQKPQIYTKHKARWAVIQFTERNVLCDNKFGQNSWLSVTPELEGLRWSKLAQIEAELCASDLSGLILVFLYQRSWWVILVRTMTCWASLCLMQPLALTKNTDEQNGLLINRYFATLSSFPHLPPILSLAMICGPKLDDNFAELERKKKKMALIW